MPVFFCLIGMYYRGYLVFTGSVALEFTLYSRSNCDLCAAMEEELRPFIAKYKITVNRQYVDNKPDLEQRYGSKVPVLSLDGKTLCEYFLDAALLSSVISQDDPATDK